MKKKDGRAIKKEDLFLKRKKAIALFEKKKMTQSHIGAELGVGRDVVGKWIKIWKEGGMKALQPKTKGRPNTISKTLTQNEIKELKKSLINFNSKKYGEGGEFWNWKSLQELIEIRFSKKLARRTLMDYLYEFGIQPSRPLGSYVDGNAAFDNWFKEDFLEIQEEVLSSGAKMLWLAKDKFFPNPSNRNSKTQYQTVAVVNNRGSSLFQIEKVGRMSYQNLRSFFDAVVKNFDQKIFLLLEDIPEHHTYIIQTWLRQQSGSIELIHYPPLKQFKSNARDTAKESQSKTIKINEKVREIESYRVIKFLGEGRIGKVYKVQNAEGEIKAIKIIHAHVLADQDLRAKCLESLQTQYQLRNNKHIIRIEEIHESADAVIVVMKHLSQIKLRYSSGRQIFWMAGKLFNALKVIHEFGATHGNLKESNLLVDSEGVIKTGDFWLEKNESLFYLKDRANELQVQEIQKAKELFDPYFVKQNQDESLLEYWEEFMEQKKYSSFEGTPAYQASQFLSDAFSSTKS